MDGFTLKSATAQSAAAALEHEINQLSARIQPFGDFQHTPGPLLWELRELCDMWTRAQAKGALI